MAKSCYVPFLTTLFSLGLEVFHIPCHVFHGCVAYKCVYKNARTVETVTFESERGLGTREGNDDVSEQRQDSGSPQLIMCTEIRQLFHSSRKALSLVLLSVQRCQVLFMPGEFSLDRKTLTFRIHVRKTIMAVLKFTFPSCGDEHLSNEFISLFC